MIVKNATNILFFNHKTKSLQQNHAAVKTNKENPNKSSQCNDDNNLSTINYIAYPV